MSTDASRRICFLGALLLLLGLLSGALVPIVTNPRMGLSAHLAGVQNGVLLLAVGLLWGRLELAGSARTACAWLSVGSLYLLWIATVLGAAFGTSRATPIAGEGFSGAAWQEALVSGLFGLGSAGALAAVALVVWGLRGSGR